MPLIAALEAADELADAATGLVEGLFVAPRELLPEASADPLDGDDPAPKAAWRGAGSPPGFPDAGAPDGRFDAGGRGPETAAEVVGHAPGIEPAASESLAGGFAPAGPFDPSEVDGSLSGPTSWPGPFVAPRRDVARGLVPAIADERPAGDALASGPDPIGAESPAG
jgi:hypothetical protein